MNAQVLTPTGPVVMPAPAVTVINTRPEHVRRLAELQPISFPTLHHEEYLRAEHFLNHLRLFPDGQFVALDNDVPVASTSTMRIDFDFESPQHSFLDIIDHGWLSGHNPRGSWLYGADMNVMPEYRGLGVGRQLYAARTALVERLNLRGQIAGGMLPGYIQHADRLTPLEYCRAVVSGQLTDPTLTPQLKSGFRFVEVLYDYFVNASGAYKAAALIVKDNPHFTEIPA